MWTTNYLMIVLGVLALIIGFFLKNSIKDEFKLTRKIRYGIIIFGVLSLVTSIYSNQFYPVYGMAMYWIGNTL